MRLSKKEERKKLFNSYLEKRTSKKKAIFKLGDN